MKCKAYLLADSIDIKALPDEMRRKETCYFQLENNKYVIFPFGVIICWGDGHLAPALVITKPYLKDSYSEEQIRFDEFEVEENSSSHNKIITKDKILLPDLHELTLVAISHPIAQSLRLIRFEDEILESNRHFMHIPEQLAKYGKIKESKAQISRMQGHLYSVKSRIRLEHSILDKPEFFWEYPELDDIYVRMSNYLEIHQRLAIIDKKFETIDEILSILSSELNHRHSSKLEWIIIILIMIEIVIFFIQDIFKLI